MFDGNTYLSDKQVDELQKELLALKQKNILLQIKHNRNEVDDEGGGK